MQANDINIAVHIGMGAGGLICGLLPMLSSKGGSIHRRSGQAFVAMAGVVLGTAILADLFFSVPMALIAATLAACYQYAGSLRSLALRSKPPSTLDATLALIALVGCVWILLAKSPGTKSWPPVIAYSTAAYVGCIAIYDLSRPFWGAYWLRYARPLDHGLKMIGCYFAMLSSGAGNLLRHAQPWSQVIPSSLGIVMMMIMFVRHGRKQIP